MKDINKMIERPYEKLFCEKCKHKIVENSKDRCKESTNSFTMTNQNCSVIPRCIHFEKDKNKKEVN